MFFYARILVILTIFEVYEIIHTVYTHVSRGDALRTEYVQIYV